MKKANEKNEKRMKKANEKNEKRMKKEKKRGREKEEKQIKYHGSQSRSRGHVERCRSGV